MSTSIDTGNQAPASLVRFGQTDLHVSRLCQGTAFRHLPRADDPRGLQVLHHCLDRGVNFFDSAQAYGWGGAEQVLGKAIAGRRDQVIICTKVPPTHKPEREGDPGKPARFTRDYLFQQVEGSLQRLGTDYLDLYLLHQPDKVTPAAEIIEPMDELVRAGKIRYWGVSNHSGIQVSEYVELAKTTGKAPIAGTEDYYNIAGENRNPEGESRMLKLEQELFPVLRRAGLGLLAFSPIDCGYLAPGREGEASAPLAALIQVLDQVAGDLGVARASVCVAWMLTHPEVTSVLAGSESPEHVDHNLAGIELELPPEALETLNAASARYREEQIEENRA